MIHLGEVPAGSVIPIPFDSYAGSTGASAAASGLAVGDIKIYKNGSVTQRSSTNGFTLLDTDGLDFDSITGLNGFSIDLSDNSDAGFYSVGAWYWVVINSVTIDGQTVNATVATFRIGPAENIAGYRPVDVAAISGDATAADNLEAYSDGTTPQPVNVTQISGDAPAADNAEAFFDGTGYAGTNNTIPTVTTVGTVNALAADSVNAGAMNANATAEIADAILTRQMTESYAADGTAPTPAQMLFQIWSFLANKVVTGVTVSCKRLDGTTEAMTMTLDDADNPTSILRGS
jgi:hypothetical protein